MASNVCAFGEYLGLKPPGLLFIFNSNVTNFGRHQNKAAQFFSGLIGVVLRGRSQIVYIDEGLFCPVVGGVAG